MKSARGAASEAAKRRLRLFGRIAGICALKRGPSAQNVSDLSYIASAPEKRLFTAAEIKREWLEALSGGGAPGFDAGLFVSFPFCAARCTYCRYFKAMARGRAELGRYAGSLCRSAGYYSRVFEKLPFSSVYFGGGTPTLLSARRLDEVCRAVLGAIKTSPRASLTVETNPASAAEEKLKLFCRYGFNRISFGVQTMTPQLLKGLGRGYQTAAMVAAAVENSRKAGFERVNADVILGLAGDTRRDFLRSFRELARLGPDTITVYPNEPTSHYLERHYGGDQAKCEAAMAGQSAWLKEAAGWAEASGFRPNNTGRISDGILFEKKRDASYEDRSYQYEVKRRGQSLFGLGSGCSSYIFNRLRYDCVSAGAGPAGGRYYGWRVTPADEARYYVLCHFARGEAVSAAVTARLFGVDVLKVFGEGLSMLEELGFLELSRGEFRIRRGTGPRDLFVCGMFLFEPRRLLEAVKSLSPAGT